ncbi:MAG: glycosyltransferase family 4 protein [Cryobacterium sp.]|uniref:glycosyltransferase family 4 protein n=1 Tax=unclassified Cryobacterium TaxID=2649013 RepID=UPI0018CB1DC8|nr:MULTISPECIES: glycosyltransferase family 4 protein [unclassified Cryobacterium]MCY7404117.1 glycosyltransferase family 4 protein [Cryobacterium sp.]MEC5153499.1 glycosyltransferase involved in cell wall biosynthesis [Cryobacterium sp. CAN_C3]
MSLAETHDTGPVDTDPIEIHPIMTEPADAESGETEPGNTQPITISPMVAPSPERLLAVHIGRSGEVAGGMSQVVNGYLAHSFADFDLHMISSRDGSGGVRAVAVAASAFWTVLRLSNPENTVVIAHLSQGGSFGREGALLALARARGFATVAQLHGSSFAAFAQKRPGLVGRILRAADVVLALSAESRAAAAEFVPGERVVLVPNAVADGVRREIEPLMVFGGAVSKRKGVDVLAAAWQRLAPEHPRWRLVIAGPITDQPMVPLTRAEFVGPLSHKALMVLLERSAIAVLPSREEAMPMFILEAMARDNCVVATRVGGVPAVLANGVGVIVEPGDIDSLESALRHAMTDTAWRTKKADLARSAFENAYSAAAVFPLVERSWKAALDRRSERVVKRYRPD